jgi:RNA recognition motif-containing protein
MRRHVCADGRSDALSPATAWWATKFGPFHISPESNSSGLPFPATGDYAVGKKLYCGNLSYNTSSSDLDQLFSEFGRVQSAEVIMDRDTGRSKGFGFVEMSSDAEAQAAIEGLNLKEHDGRALAVNEARPREERRGGGGGGGGRGGGRGGYGGGGGGGRGGRGGY